MPAYLGTLGMPGMTAYFGLLDVGKPRPGETVVVSGAAGAVGAVVGQIAKIKECRVVGIAGGVDKCALPPRRARFRRGDRLQGGGRRAALGDACPKGIDVYFDNVGGDILDAALSRLAMHARVVICGAISQYNNTDRQPGPANYLSLLVNRASMTGMVVFDYASALSRGGARVGRWMAERPAAIARGYRRRHRRNFRRRC